MQAFGRVAMTCASLWLTATLVQAQVPAGYPADYKAIVDGAKKEGKVVVYSTTDAKLVSPLIKDFEAAFPGVKVEYTDLNSTEVYNRFISESAADAASADAVWSSSMDLQMKLAADGLAAVYKSPESAALPEWAHFKDMVYATTFEPIAIVYNKRLVPAEDVPKTHADFTKLLTTKADKYQKKVTTYDAEKSGVGFMLVNQDAKLNPAFWDLVKAMGARGANMQSSTGTMMERVASGENLIGYNILGSYALTRAKKDPSIGIAFTTDYNLVLSRLAFVSKNAKNPERRPALGRLSAVEARADDHGGAGRALFGAHRHDGQGLGRRVRQGTGQRGQADRRQQRPAAGARPDEAARIPEAVADGARTQVSARAS